MNTIYTPTDNVYFSFKEPVTYYQIENLKEKHQLCDNNTTTPSKVTNFKSYVSIAGCLLEHIIHISNLSSSEKLNYLLADALSLINHNKGKKRAIALAGNQWAKKLNCSKSTVFSSQKSLVEKGYFNVLKDKNEKGQNERNIITPTIPDSIFETLKHADNRSKDLIAEYDSKTESKIDFLRKTKLFVKLNYYLLKTITCNASLNPLQKIIWLDFYLKCYKCYHNTKGQGGDCFFTASYQELSTIYSCDKSTLSKSLNVLEKAGFIKREHFFIKHTQSINARRDNSLWKFTISLPETLNPEAMNMQDFFNISFIDPDNAKSGVQLKKNLLSVKDIDNIDTNCQNFSKKSKNLSKLNNNIIKEKKRFKPTAIPHEQEVVNGTSKITAQNKKLIAKSLKDYYPLSKAEVDILQTKSGREFSTNFTNELLLKLSDKYPDRRFLSKNQMLSYMSKALKHEKHQAPLVNHESFRFGKNIEDSEEANKKEKDKKIEEYLLKIENKSTTDKLTQLEKKIAGVFAREEAYEILKNCKFNFNSTDEKNNNKYPPKEEIGIEKQKLERTMEELIQEMLKEAAEYSFGVKLSNGIKLTESQQQILQAQISSVYGVVKIKYEQAFEKIKMKEVNSKKEEKQEIKTGWVRIKEEIVKQFDESIDKIWLSKLEAEEDKKARTLKLKTSNSYIRDRIERDYSIYIEKYGRVEGFKVITIVSDSYY